MLSIFKFLFNRSRKKNEFQKKEFKEKIAFLGKDIKNRDAVLSQKNLLISDLESASNKKDETLSSLYETIDKKNDDLAKYLETMRFLAFELEEKDKELDSKNEKLEFIAQVINSQPVKKSSYEKYMKLLSHDYMEYANKNNSLAGEAAALLKLQNVSKQLELLTYDYSLLNKTIIAIAGSYSSGKSSFLNSFFKTRKIVLPIGMDQTTAISSYVMNGSESITGYSYKGGRVNIANNVFRLFSYGKVEEFKFNMKQIINHIVFKNDFVKELNNLCFIDTPGFNPGHETRSDCNTATTSISTANSIIWCVDAGAGTIKSDELDILYDIFHENENIRIYIVLNKADIKPFEENCLIMDEIEYLLDAKDIPFEGITLYTSHRTFTDQPEECNFYKRMSLADFIDENNCENKEKEETLLKSIDEVFNEYINADKQRIMKLKKQLETIKILENSFSSINDRKDEQISYYKARMDTKHYKSKEFADSTNNDEKLFDSLADLKSELKNTIENDKSDIEKATDLSTRMKEAVSEIFHH